MKTLSKLFVPCAAGLAILLASVRPASAQEQATLLFGCQIMPGGGGIEVVFADSSAPIPTADGARLPASALVGRRCPDAIGLLLENDLVDRDQLSASQHLVINTERRSGDGDDIDIPDCIIWNIDGAEVASTQLVCDPSGDNRIVVQESGTRSRHVKNYLGWSCVDALADLGGLANVVRTSVIRPAQAPIRTRWTRRVPSQPGSIAFYQFSLRMP